MYDHNVNFQTYCTFLTLLCVEILYFLSTVSSFLHIMIVQNVDFCKNKLRFMPLIIFIRIVYITDDEDEHIFFHSIRD